MASSETAIVKPTKEQAEWADCEIGVLIHLDMQVFDPGYDFRGQWGWHPEASLFNPSALDTSQWIAAARAGGAKYAVLVAKHCSGFCLWPTAAHGYSVKSSPWKNGRGDVVRDFMTSCRKYGLKPGLYYSSSCNAYLGVDNPGTVVGGTREDQEKYNAIVIEQLTELWGDYGELFEIWFDGGILPPELGGPDIVPLLIKLQPKANVFQGRKGMRSLLRWAGNEDGCAPYPCWSTASLEKNDFDGTVDCPGAGTGDPFAPVWAPAEADLPIRNRTFGFQNGWLWREGEDSLVHSAGYLAERYFQSVGRNANMLLGMVVDNRGLVPDEDAGKFAAFGGLLRKVFDSGNLLGEGAGTGEKLTVELKAGGEIKYVVIMEDITQGERILDYSLLGFDGKTWKEIGSGTSVGHKRIQSMQYPYPSNLASVRLVCKKYKAEPVICRLAVYS